MCTMGKPGKFENISEVADFSGGQQEAGPLCKAKYLGYLKICWINHEGTRVSKKEKKVNGIF